MKRLRAFAVRVAMPFASALLGAVVGAAVVAPKHDEVDVDWPSQMSLRQLIISGPDMKSPFVMINPDGITLFPGNGVGMTTLKPGALEVVNAQNLRKIVVDADTQTGGGIELWRDLRPRAIFSLSGEGEAKIRFLTHSAHTVATLQELDGEPLFELYDRDGETIHQAPKSPPPQRTPSPLR